VKQEVMTGQFHVLSHPSVLKIYIFLYNM